MDLEVKAMYSKYEIIDSYNWIYTFRIEQLESKIGESLRNGRNSPPWRVPNLVTEENKWPFAKKFLSFAIACDTMIDTYDIMGRKLTEQPQLESTTVGNMKQEMQMIRTSIVNLYDNVDELKEELERTYNLFRRRAESIVQDVRKVIARERTKILKLGIMVVEDDGGSENICHCCETTIHKRAPICADGVSAICPTCGNPNILFAPTEGFKWMCMSCSDSDEHFQLLPIDTVRYSLQKCSICGKEGSVDEGNGCMSL